MSGPTFSSEIQPSAEIRPSKADRSKVLTVLGVLFLLALVLRFWGITFGLPFSYQVSENMYIAAAQNAARTGYPNVEPLFGIYQAMLLVEHKILTGLTPLLESVGVSERLLATINSPETSFNLVGRWTSAFFGALTILPLFWIGRRLWGPRAGLLAAFFLAVLFMHVRSSHYAKPEIVACFFVVLGACFTLDFKGKDGPWRPYLLAGLCLGLALSAKLLAWPLIPVICLMHLWITYASRGSEEGPSPVLKEIWSTLGGGLRALFSSKLIGAGVASIAIFVILSPQSILKPINYYRFWLWVAEIGNGGGMERFDLHAGKPIWQVYASAFSWGVGWLLGLVIVASTLFFAWNRQPRQLFPLLVFPLVLLSFLLKPGNLAHERYLLLMLPFLVLLAAGGLETLIQRIPSRQAQLAVAWLVPLLITAQPLLSSLRHDYLLAQTDTRTQAKEWIESNLPEDTALALEVWFFGPQLSSASIRVPMSNRKYRFTTTGPYGLHERSKVSGPSKGTLTPGSYIVQGYEYVVVDGYTEQIPRLDPVEERLKKSFYAGLEDRATLIKEFSALKPGEAVPYDYPRITGPTKDLWSFERNGPPIRIYELPRMLGSQ